MAAKYVVTQPFTINFEKNGMRQVVSVEPNDVILFDGVNFMVGNTQGSSPSLKAVIRDGDWVHPIDDKDGSGSAVKIQEKPVVSPARTYNATGGVQIEMSDPVEDNNLYMGRSHNSQRGADDADDLTSAVRNYEEQSGKIEVVDDMSDIREETRTTPKITTQDIREVAKVRGSARKAAQTSSGAVSTRDKTDDSKKSVVRGTRMAKQTAPSKSPDGYKHINVDSSATGVEVSKVSDRSDASMKRTGATGDERQVVDHQKDVKSVSVPSSKKTVVGSSTQATVEKMADVQPEVTVVSTVKDEFETASKDGIKSTLTVKSSDDMSIGEATSTSTDAVELSGDLDIDVNDLLEN